MDEHRNNMNANGILQESTKSDVLQPYLQPSAMTKKLMTPAPIDISMRHNNTSGSSTRFW